MPRNNLPILDNLDDIRIASPCHAEWDAMRPLPDEDGARARFCGSCEKNVYDLSSMTRVDALDLIKRQEGSCCVRFYRRTDGTVLTEDCPVGFAAALRRAQLRTLSGIATCAGAVAAAVAFLLGTANPVSRKLESFENGLRPVAGGIEAMPIEPIEPEMGARMPDPPRPPPVIKQPTPKPKPAPKMGKMAPRPIERTEVMMGDVLDVD
ncbi:MAG: hypothetical protein Q8O67_26765 [Deltaproteobacteria bacterium]|nr:hypothetical protein [Deltaproteobacteria bacterium]